MLEDGTTTFQGHDFFTPQPPLPEPKSTIPPLPRTKATYGAGSFDGGTPSPPMERASSDGVPSSDRGLCAFPSSTFPPPVTKTPIYASVFLLRVITHDWPDAHVTR